MSLRYNVATLLREPVGSTREYDIDDRVLIDDTDEESRRVGGHATFLRVTDGVLVTAHLEGIEPEQCSRCLQNVDLPLDIDFEEEFFASVELETGTPLPPPEDPEAFRIDAHHMLELEEAVRQFWTTALPMQPLCRPDCRGLCARCGQDLNQGACACPPEEDGRWGALRQLVGELEGS